MIRILRAFVRPGAVQPMLWSVHGATLQNNTVYSVTFRRVDFQFAKNHAIGSRKLHDDVSGRLKAGVLALQFDGRTLRYSTRILATHVVVADLRTVHKRMYVRQTDNEIRRPRPCTTVQRHNTTVIKLIIVKC